MEHAGSDLPVGGGVIDLAVRLPVTRIGWWRGLWARGVAPVRPATATGRGGGWKVAGGVLVEPGLGVGEFAVAAVLAEAEVQVRAGGVTGLADIANVLSDRDGVADVDVKAGLPLVGVGDGDLLPADGVFDEDQPVVPAGHQGVGADAVGGGEDRAPSGAE